MTRKRYHKKGWRKKQRHDHHVILGAVIVGITLLAFIGSISASFVINTSGLFIIIIFLITIIGIGALLARRRWKQQQDHYYKLQGNLKALQDMDPFEFEHYVGWFYSKIGYSVDVTKGSGDHGIDVQMSKNGQKYVVQVKRYKNANIVGEPTVRDFYGSFVDLSVAGGIFLTTSSFTRQARAWAKDKKRLKLVDGQDFIKAVNHVNENL